MLIDITKNKKSLADLWHRVFGDPYSYIELIFKEEYSNSILCFGEIKGEEVVSAFYLLKNTLKFEGKLYNGVYLYAAATLPEYRGDGLMSALINEAQEYCRENGYDFVSLVPSENSLYNYYSRFGFESAMYRYKGSITHSGKASVACKIIENSNAVLSVRSKYDNNIITFDKNAFSYAADCLKAGGYSFYLLSEDSYALFSKEQKSVEEFISPTDKLDINGRILCDLLPEDNITISAPFELPFCEIDIEKSGMLYPVNAELCREWKYTEIYMNIALD